MQRWVGAWFEDAVRLARFLRRPSLDIGAPSPAPVQEAIALFATLSFAMVAVSLALMPVAIWTGAGQSTQLSSAMAADPLNLVLAVVILGPVIEELVFRSWLDARWRHLAAAASFAIVLFGGRYAVELFGLGEWEGAGYVVLGAALVTFGLTGGIVGGVARLGERAEWLKRFYPAVFWLHVIVFGWLHVFNYAGAIAPALLLFTLPQMIAGAVFGYARLRLGLAYAIGLHMAFNAVPVGLTLAGRLV